MDNWDFELRPMEMSSAWYNFRTGEYDFLYPSDFDAADKHDYIPQIRSVQAMYDIYTEHMGDEPLEAMRKVLEACVQ